MSKSDDSLSVDQLLDTVDEIQTLLPWCARLIDAFFDPDYGYTRTIGLKTGGPVSHASCLEAAKDLPPSRHNSAKIWPDQRHGDFMIEALSMRASSDLRSYEDSFVLGALRLFPKEALDRVVALPAYLKATITCFRAWIDNALRFPTAEPDVGIPHSHGFFLYRVRRALWILERDLSSHLDKAQMDEVQTAANDLDALLLDKLYYQSAICSSLPDNEEDTLQLGYVLYALLTYTTRLSNDLVATHSLRLISQSLFAAGHVPRLQIIYRSDAANVNATPLDMLGQLSKLSLVESQFELLAPMYEKAYRWLRSTARNGLATPADPKVPTWMQEPWRGATSPEAWINCAAVQFLVRYSDLLRRRIASSVSVTLGASIERPNHEWIKLQEFQATKRTLEEGLIKAAKSKKSWQRLEKSSAILFGPPGTAKTSYARALAWELQWPFVELMPHHFAMNGPDGVVRSISDIFRRLMHLRECVVFFDEIDELVADRSGTDSTILGRFITTSVLPWFQELRDEGQVIFIVATNKVDRFDGAVKRPGRFDFVLPVGPPSPADGVEIFKTMLEALSPIVASSELVGVYRSVMEAQNPQVSLTVGEINFAVKACAAESDIAVAKSGLTRVLGQLVGRPLIDGQAMLDFQDSIKKYQFPPREEI